MRAGGMPKTTIFAHHECHSYLGDGYANIEDWNDLEDTIQVIGIHYYTN